MQVVERLPAVPVADSLSAAAPEREATPLGSVVRTAKTEGVCSTKDRALDGNEFGDFDVLGLKHRAAFVQVMARASQGGQ